MIYQHNPLLTEALAVLKFEEDFRAKSICEHFQEQMDVFHADIAAKFDRIVAAHGMERCHECRGHGAVERIDSAVMRRFGCREWDGCKACGGHLDARGYGYVPVKES